MSGGDFQLLPILIFAVVAGVLFFKLRSVLGRRTGNERRVDPFAPPPPPPPASGPFNPPPGNGPVIEGQATEVGATRAADNPAPTGRTAGSTALRAADPSFDESAFIKGARAAFTMVVNAFAAGDTAALKPLLSPEVFDSFAGAIRARGSNATQGSPLVALKSAEIVDSAVEGATALVTVKFVSDQNGAGKIDSPIEEHVDHWVFSRSLRSHDPNWVLIATKNTDG